MKKTSVYLDPETDAALARLARSRGKSKAEIVREALDEKARSAPATPRIGAIGVGQGPGDVSDNVDRYLAEALAGERRSRR